MKPSLKILLSAVIVIAISLIVYLILVRGSALNAPESIAWDAAAKRFLISNVQGKSIVAMSPEGKYSAFLKKGLKSPRGLAIKGENLYVADESTLHVIDLKTAKISKSIPIEGAKLLNDVALDKKGFIYLTDTLVNCVYIVDPGTFKADKVISPLLKSPNGIVYDMPRDQMFIVGFANRAPILSLSTVDRSVKVFMDSIYSNLDGIAIDDLGRIYISSWEQDMIIEIPQEQNRFIAQFKDIKDAADILYYLPNNELIVPLNSQNKIIRIPLD